MRAEASRVCNPTSFGASACGLLEGLHRVLAAAGRGIGAAQQIVGFGVALAGLGDLGQRFDRPDPGGCLANCIRASTL